MKAKTERNLHILLAKEGKDDVHGDVVRKQTSYTELAKIFDLSVPRLILIVQRERKRYHLI